MTTDAPVYLVTGAAGNLGRATLGVLAQGGARLVAAGSGAAPEKPGDLLWLEGSDLTDPSACEALVAAALDRFGRLDGAAHLVGGFTVANVAKSDTAVWEEMFRLNLLTTLNVFRAAIPPMRAARRGSLVGVGASAALRAPSGFGPYAASKAAVLRLVEAYSEELKAEGVRVNAVMPGTMDTPQNRTAMPKADPALWVRPAEVAAAIAFLLGDAASAVTGAALPVFGRA